MQEGMSKLIESVYEDWGTALPNTTGGEASVSGRIERFKQLIDDFEASAAAYGDKRFDSAHHEAKRIALIVAFTNRLSQGI